MKLAVYFALAFLLGLTACKDSPVADKNAENLKKLKLGMRIEEVEKIMGTPETIEIYPFNKEEYVFRYLSPFGYSDQFYIFISRKDSTVVRIGNGL